jgi:hypothetical protein
MRSWTPPSPNPKSGQVQHGPLKLEDYHAFYNTTTKLHLQVDVTLVHLRLLATGVLTGTDLRAELNAK